MEQLQFEFKGRAAKRAIKNLALPNPCVLVGVVSSGNLEVMMEKAALGGNCKVVINTSIQGYNNIWRAVLKDLFQRHALADVLISINDAGATPAVVGLRLDQAVEEFLAA
jgi:malonate decarboxylase delta subunit